MENEDQFSLVAAGSIYPDYLDPVKYPEPVTALTVSTDVGMVAAMVLRQVKEQLQQDERTQRLRDLKEDEEIYRQRERARRWENVFAADVTDDTPVAGSAPAPAPEAPVEPVPEEVAAASEDDQWLIDAQNASRFHIIEPSPLQQANPFPNTAPIAPPGGAPAPAPAAPAEPVPAAPAPPGPVA
jgi:hypothetical protein